MAAIGGGILRVRGSPAMTRDDRTLPPNLAVPVDDGAADHLPGSALPAVRLRSTLGTEVDLAAAAGGPGRLVVFVYPRTGRPGEPLIEGWDEIPGARGCTAQSCAFRDHVAEFGALGATLLGVSSQSPEDQDEFAAREHIPYPLLSDEGLVLAGDLGLPTFGAGGLTHYRRLTFVAREGRIEHVFYPVFPPDRSAVDVLEWLAARRAGDGAPA
jgi:peroxiredoxin